MDYNKIKILCENKNTTVRDLCNTIKISEAGLYQMFRNKSMKIETLEKIAEALNIPVSTFFNDNIELNNNVENNGNKNITLQNNSLGDNNKVNILLHDKDEEIEKLKREIDHLKSLLEAKDKIISLLERK